MGFSASTDSAATTRLRPWLGLSAEHAHPPGDGAFLPCGERRPTRTAGRRPSGSRRRSSSFDGAKVGGLVGFTNEDAPALVSPTLRSVHVGAPAAGRPGRGQQSCHAIWEGVGGPSIVMGRDRATAGTLLTDRRAGRSFAPLSDNLRRRRRRVIGDPRTRQVVSRRPNGVLTTGNRSKGLPALHADPERGRSNPAKSVVALRRRTATGPHGRGRDSGRRGIQARIDDLQTTG